MNIAIDGRNTGEDLCWKQQFSNDRYNVLIAAQHSASKQIQWAAVKRGHHSASLSHQQRRCGG